MNVDVFTELVYLFNSHRIYLILFNVLDLNTSDKF